MASAVYPLAKQEMMKANINLNTGDVKVGLLSASYTYSAAHQYWSSASANLIHSLSGTLTSRTFTSGVFDADDVTYTAVSAGSTIAAFAGIIDTGVGSTSPLIFFVDGLSTVTNGSDVLIVWSSGSNKIFAL